MKEKFLPEKRRVKGRRRKEEESRDGGRGAPDAGADIPLQPMEIQGEQIPLAACGGPCIRAAGCPKETL